ncbi:hypothetical protein HNV11_17740 [Spirosoma taeanense]|uniref:Uncharacterized protein n=1 Tax=Spirosoma taeanense TaxID=2735870 RepID=A0A6M5YEG3_9BACT|nr:hypothetical protein HNV11_17740 [Spirosoma taeanense]
MLVAALPVGYYFAVLGWFAYDMPYMDDYPVLVDFLNQLPDASVGEQWRLLLEQNNFHRVVWVKAVVAFAYALSGQVNFSFLQYLGNVPLLLIAILFWRAHIQPLGDRFIDSAYSSRNLITFLPVLFLLFQFQYWNNTFWAMAALSNLWSPTWTLLAFWLVSRKQAGWALFVAVAALLTNGNGILVLPLLLAGFALNQNWRWAVCTLLVLVLAYGLYFSGYSNPSKVSLADLLAPATFAHLLALDTAFLGAMFYHPAVSWLPQVAGWATIGWTAYLLVTRYDRRNPTLFWMLVFLQLTGLMLAVNRIHNSVDVVFASRYKQVTALLMAVTYMTLADVIRQKSSRAGRWFSALALAGAMGICVVSNVTYFSKIVRFRELKQTDQLLWERYGIIRGCSPIYEPAQQLSQLKKAGIFQPQPLTVAQLVSHEVTLPTPAATADRVTYQIDLRRRDGDFLVVSGFAKIAGQKANFNDTFVGVLLPSGQWRFFSTLFHQRLDNEDSLNDKDTGFTAIIPASIAGTSSRIGLLVRSGTKTAFQEL